MSQSDPILTDRTEAAVLNEIANEIKSGMAVTPFTGAGLSAQSGIPMGADFKQLLAHTLRLTLDGSWSVHHQGWPQAPTEERFKETKKAIKSWNKKGRDGFSSGKSDFHIEFSERVKRDGYRLLHEYLDPNCDAEWHEVLNFIAQIRVDYIGAEGSKSEKGISPTTEPQNRYMLRLNRTDSSVIDTFNAFITRGRKPNLGHTMIARLARSLRSRVILTTNFDTLLEESFTSLSRKLQVFAVSSKGSLPPFASVNAQDSLIKLHGDILETRADETLNHNPEMADLRRFFEYLHGPVFSRESRDIQPWEMGFTPSHLLVLGYSGADKRCRKMIEFCLAYSKDFRVFWVCNSKRTLGELNRYFANLPADQLQRICCCITGRTDLFLYSLYQKLNNSLPGGGFNYEFTHSVPPMGVQKGEPPSEELEKQRLLSLVSQPEDAQTGITQAPSTNTGSRETRNHPRGRLLVFDRKSEITAPIRYVFNHLQDSMRCSCVWLDLDDYSSVDNLEFQILSVLSLRKGQFQADHINLLPTQKENENEETRKERRVKYLNRVLDLLTIDRSKCWVFLYGRNAPGACAGFLGRGWDREDYKDLNEMMDVWSRSGINIIYMPMSFERFDRNTKKESFVEGLLDQWELDSKPSSRSNVDTSFDQFRTLSRKEYLLPNTIVDHITKASTENTALPAFNPHEKVVFEAVIKENLLESWLGLRSQGTEIQSILKKTLAPIKWPNTENEPPVFWRMRFLYALTLFRQSRHPAAMVSEATIPCPKRFNGGIYSEHNTDNDEVRVRFSRDWISDLDQFGLLLEKPGGYKWKYRDVRTGIRRLLEGMGPFGDSNGSGHFDFLGQVRARTHFWIGEWYFRAFLSSGHFMPLIECLYHRLQTIKWAAYAKPKHLSLRKKKDLPRIVAYRRLLVEAATNEAVKAARMGRESMKFWLPGINLKGMDGNSLDEICNCSFNTANNGTAFGITWETVHGRNGEVRSRKAKGSWRPRNIDLLREELDRLFVSISAEGGRKQGKYLALFESPTTRSSSQKGIKQPYSVKISEDNFLVFDDWGNFKRNFDLCEASGSKSQFYEQINQLLVRSIEDGSAIGSKVAAWRENWLDARNGNLSRIHDQRNLFQFVHLLGEYAYALTKKARFLGDYHLASKDKAARSLSGRYWLASCITCNTCLSILHFLDPVHLKDELPLRAQTLTIYGLSLGALGRYREAHRRFNEAHAVLSKSQLGLRGVSFAVLNLRRAEVYVIESERRISSLNSGEKDADVDKNFRQTHAALNDAWSSLEVAEAALAGLSHSSTWWHRLLSLRVEIFHLWGKVFHPPCKQSELGLAFRMQADVQHALENAYLRVSCVCDWSLARQIVFFWKLASACLVHCRCDKNASRQETDGWSRILEALRNEVKRLRVEVSELESRISGNKKDLAHFLNEAEEFIKRAAVKSSETPAVPEPRTRK